MYNLLHSLAFSFVLGIAALFSTSPDSSVPSDEALLNLEIVCPTDIVVNLASGACESVVDFLVTATDDTDPNLLIEQIDLSGLSSGDAFPIGIHTLEFQASNNNGDVATCSFQIEVQEFPFSGAMSCKDDIEVYLGTDACLTLSAGMILQGNNYGCFDLYTAQVLNAQGFPAGSSVCCDQVGLTLTVRVQRPGHGQCWSAVMVLDTLPPVFICPSLSVGCMSDYTELPLPSVEDNCGIDEITVVSEGFLDGDFCDNGQLVFERLVTATDIHGNEALPCLQQITITRTPAPAFPDDRIWNCEELLEYPQLTEPLAFAPDDLLVSGSGVVANIDGPCEYLVSFDDDIVPLCGSTFEILRTWTLLDQCSGNEEEHVQSILIVDSTPPSIQRAPYSVFTNITGDFPPDCTSEGFLLIPLVEDACGADWTLRIYTPIGEAIYLNGEDGKLGGYIPEPGLDPGIYTITYEAEDACGNLATLDVSIEVVDAATLMPVVLDCPTNRTLNCNVYAEDLADGLAMNDYSVLEAYGDILLFENCLSEVSYTVMDNVDTNCYAGDLIRIWTITDDNGSTECVQTLSFLHTNSWEIQFPLDITVACLGDELEDTGEPEVFFDECELIGIAFEDQVFLIVPDACFEIRRTWTAINWCVYDGSSGNSVQDTLVSPGRFKVGADGYVSFLQRIKVNNAVPPAIVSLDPLLTFCVDDNSCSVDIMLPIPEVSDCLGIASVILSGNMPGALPGSPFEFADVPPGVYSMQYKVQDNCSMLTTYPVTVEVLDCQAPEAICKQWQTVSVNAFTYFTIVEAQSLLDNGSFDNCSGDLIYSFSSDTSYQQHIFYCEDAQQTLFDMELWVTDATGNQSFCTSTVIVQDNDMTHCDWPDPNAITGKILMETGTPVVGVDVLVNMVSLYVTDANGVYGVFAASNWGSQEVTPSLNTNPTNGVTTFDMVLIQLHILGEMVLNSPYKLIAADINNSGTITTSDIVAGRRLILNIDDNFQNNTSWRFVVASYVFPDPTNPWLEPFPESIFYPVVFQDYFDQDYVGIKIGDVNNSANFNLGGNGQPSQYLGTLPFHPTDASLEAGTEWELKMSPGDFYGYGCQFTLEFDPELLRLSEFLPGLAREEHIGWNRAGEGILTVSWNDLAPRRLRSDEPLFSLRFISLRENRPSEHVRINSRITPAEAYGPEGELNRVSLRFHGKQDVPMLYQNAPNPFREQTRIGFYLPEAGSATLRVIDIAGRLLYQSETSYDAGYHEWIVTGIQQPGVLYYQLSTSGHTLTKRMLLVN